MDAVAIQLEARALGDPTRYRLFRYIVDSDQPVGVAELTDYVGLNHNAVRQHFKQGDSVETLERELIESGFRPTRRERGRQVTFVLGRCPFEEVAADDPDTVCQLHLGLAKGLSESLGDVTVDRLTAKDPHRAGCRLVFERDLVSRPT